jgi:hypothetical protein
MSSLCVFDSLTDETEKKRGTGSSAFFGLRVVSRIQCEVRGAGESRIAPPLFFGLTYGALSFLYGVAHCDMSDASNNVERSGKRPTFSLLITRRTLLLGHSTGRGIF